MATKEKGERERERKNDTARAGTQLAHTCAHSRPHTVSQHSAPRDTPAPGAYTQPPAAHTAPGRRARARGRAGAPRGGGARAAAPPRAVTRALGTRERDQAERGVRAPCDLLRVRHPHVLTYTVPMCDTFIGFDMPHTWYGMVRAHHSSRAMRGARRLLPSQLPSGSGSFAAGPLDARGLARRRRWRHLCTHLCRRRRGLCGAQAPARARRHLLAAEERDGATVQLRQPLEPVTPHRPAHDGVEHRPAHLAAIA